MYLLCLQVEALVLLVKVTENICAHVIYKTVFFRKVFFLRLLSVWCSLHHHFLGGCFDLQLSSYFLISINKILAMSVLPLGYDVPLSVYKGTPVYTRAPQQVLLLLNSGGNSIDSIPSLLPIISIFPLADLRALETLDEKAAFRTC